MYGWVYLYLITLHYHVLVDFFLLKCWYLFTRSHAGWVSQFSFFLSSHQHKSEMWVHQALPEILIWLGHCHPSSIMPNYTPAQIRDFIDDLDAILRAAVHQQRLKEVFETEKGRIVGIYINFCYHLLIFMIRVLCWVRQGNAGMCRIWTLSLASPGSCGV